MGKVVVFKKPIVLRCHSCNKIKPEIQEEFSHRGIDYSDNTQPHSWIVYQSGWKRVEVLPLKTVRKVRAEWKKFIFTVRIADPYDIH